MARPQVSDGVEYRQLAEQQAALRRVATLVAQRTPPEGVFAVVAEQVARVLQVPLVSILRYEPDGTATERASVSDQGELFAVGTRWPLGGTNVVAQVLESGRPARINDYSGLTGEIAETVRRVGIRSTVGIPIVVAGRLWGAMVVSSAEPEPLPEDTEGRLADFTELAATAIANSEAREEVERLADEQAALRRVATLVAQDAPSSELFRAVAREVGTLLGADFSGLIRYEDDATVTPVATWAALGEHPRVPDRFRTEAGDPTTMIAETRQPARVDDWTTVPGPIAAFIREELGVSSSVGSPIVVEGRLWGALAVHSAQRAPLPPDTESRIAQFTDLVSTSIANADSRAELMASRARIVAASDEARRRFERDLHDGVQQRLVSLSLELHGVAAMAPPGSEELVAQLAHVIDGLTGALDELRELSRGLHPAILSKGGLVPALRALARRSAAPVDLNLAVDQRLGDHVEVGAYYVVSEALTNAAKHAHAGHAEVRATVEDGMLHVEVRDDGIGGADPDGHGLVGMGDRVTALGGRLEIESPAGGGTLVAATLPLSGT